MRDEKGTSLPEKNESVVSQKLSERENTNNVEMSNFTEIPEFKQTAELNANLVCIELRHPRSWFP